MKPVLFVLFMLVWLIPVKNEATCSSVPDAVTALEAPGSSSLINDWITVHLKTTKNNRVPSQHIRQISLTAIALYESIVAGDNNYRSLAGQLNGYNPGKSIPDVKDICWPASANAAVAKMFRFFYPMDPVDVSRFDSLENALKLHYLKEGYTEASVRSGSEYGSAVAQTVIEWSRSDGADKANDPYTVPKGAGLYELTPPKFIPPILPYLGECRILVKGSTDNAFPPPPAAFSTDLQSPFYRMVDEVYQTSVQLDEDKKATGLFWDDFPDGKTLTGGGHWESILKTVMTDRHSSLMEGAMLYAALFITENDASIACFRAKYTYNLVRPVTYIQKHMNHPEWNPLILTPPHPEYPAAHASISMSGATILTHLLGNQVSFTDNTYAYRGYKARHFNNLIEAGREAGMSRLYGGIHYLPSIEAGYDLGEKVAENIAGALVFKNSDE